MDKLEKLLQLCQAYGCTSYADQEYKLELVHLGRSEIDDGAFEVDFSGATFTTDDEPDPEPN